ncbi:HNH endonuclease signature motif containing protein [Yersinia pseudotuberculosis]|uniref:HNH endonuclease signature motif containing protein n=2 Tax=Yersinia pseudotuberculosis TaxID=633 RepID=UPI0004F58B65|nr:HNH endonuclease signature motif containing protein [Yersinia pseudotuberculosis]AIN14807.1 DNase/tRNase domain of colicin-like bacteriocin family protein [Yersinia pseudotuberculosis]VEE73515.1 HNH endonuclease domain-containing protein [Yersinia pseudotuberculosis]
MSFNLPGMYLYYLSRDNLAPEEYERIISPHAAWARICREYEFDDSHNTSRYLINMREREQRFSPDQPRPGGIREKEKLEKLVFSGDVVMLSDMYGPARLFYINGEGQLMSADPHAFRFEGAAKIIKAFDDGVKCRNYQRTGGKPRSTKSPMKVRPSVSERSMITRASDESGRVLSAKWQSVTDSAKTLWEATPFTHDKATTEAARGRIADGAVGTLEGLGTLMGPSAQEYMAGAFNPEQAAINKVRQQNQQAAGKAIYDNTKGAVTDAYQRNGLAGAAAMVVTASVAELAGTKGLGTVEKVGTLGDVAKLGKAIELEKLEGYLGTYKGQKVLLQNVDVVKMDYFRRDRAEAAMLRSQFRSVRTKFVKSIANNPDVAKRFTLEQIDGLSNGITPSGWVVHHKLPLDDSGTNALDNLVLIKDSPEHTVLTNAQKKITNGLPHEASKEVLWPIPQGLVYP